MAVSVDTVYQRVLGILNKEQRGYVTAQEFNLYANQAQLDIFDQYFYDINQFGRLHGNDTEFSDMLNILNEKINIFEVTAPMTYQPSPGPETWVPPSDLYRMGTIICENTTTSLSLYPTPNTTVTTTTLVEAERINHNEFLYINQSPYTKPSNVRPVFVASDKGYKVYGNTALTQGVSCNYIKKPAKVQWAYTIVFQEPLYNAANSVDFELHPSEETELVIKILELSGLLIKDYQMYQVANSEEQQTIQQEKS
jgi:hypothetical protein